MSIEAIGPSTFSGVLGAPGAPGELPEVGGLSTEAPSAPGGAPFADVLEGAVRSAAVSGHEASQKAQALARGAIDDIHGTMISAKEAEVSLKLVGAVRNKLLDAFHELWRTNV